MLMVGKLKCHLWVTHTKPNLTVVWNTSICTTVNSNQETLDVLIHVGADVNIISCVGLTPLSLAVIGGSNICTKQLLNAGGDVNTFNCDHVTPLMFAAIHNYPDCLKTLLHNKADVNILDADDN